MPTIHPLKIFKHSRLLLTFAFVIANVGLLAVAGQDHPTSTDTRLSDLTGKLAEIEKQIEGKRRELGVPGVAMAMVKDDKVIYEKGFGLRDVERNLPVTPDTIFEIGSCTKAFTAMAAVISQDSGKLSFDDSPKKYLSYFKLQDPDADAMITVRDLLLHRSGLNLGDFVWYTGALNRVDLIKLAGLAKPTAKIREKFQYQNIMYTAAGEVIAKANATTWEKFVEERIFGPLDMKSSHASFGPVAKSKDFAIGYSVEDKIATKAVMPHVSFEVIAPAGAITSNVQDMSQWIRLMLGGGSFEGRRIVSEQGFNDIVKKQIPVGGNLTGEWGESSYYGLGWFLSDRNGHPLIWHSGGVPGFQALVELVPDQHLGFVVLINGSDSPLLDVIRDFIADVIVGRPMPRPVIPQGEPTIKAAPAGPEPFTGIDITVDDLMAKAIAAVGGEANLRRHHSRTGTATLDFENQGLTGTAGFYAQAPNLSAQITTFIGLGKKIGSLHEYFDGAQGGTDGSFPTEEYKGEELESARIHSDYYEQLNWKTLYKTVTIREKSRIAGEDVYVVIKTPEKGSAITDYISAKSFLLRKRETSDEESLYSDYRNVDGEMIAFNIVTHDDSRGRYITNVHAVKFNTRIPASTFRGKVR